MGPLTSRLTQLYGTRAWTVIVAFLTVVIVVIPLLRFLLPPEHALYLSDYYVLLFGRSCVTPWSRWRWI